MQKWTEANITSQRGKTVLITNSGLGLQAATVLSSKDAHVIMTVRNEEKGHGGIKDIKSKFPNARLEAMQLAKSNCNSIRKCSEEFHNKYSQLNILINNAGIMSDQNREATKQNMEVQFWSQPFRAFFTYGSIVGYSHKYTSFRYSRSK